MGKARNHSSDMLLFSDKCFCKMIYATAQIAKTRGWMRAFRIAAGRKAKGSG